jgi:hypothetical protein
MGPGHDGALINPSESLNHDTDRMHDDRPIRRDYRIPPEIVSHAGRLYQRFCL